jgi:uncharacterized protein (TIGR02117 family)
VSATAAALALVVWVVSHGWHVGLVLRRDDLAALGPLPALSAVPGRYLEVGWGDGDFYPATHGTLALALRAAFRSRSSVLQVVGFDTPVADTFPRAKVLEVELTPSGLAALVRYVEATVAMDQEGRPTVVAPAEYGSGVFYLARGHYRLLDNSNTWTARGLKVAGCPIEADSVVTAGEVLHRAARFARVVRPGLLLPESAGGSERCGDGRDSGVRGVRRALSAYDGPAQGTDLEVDVAPALVRDARARPRSVAPAVLQHAERGVIGQLAAQHLVELGLRARDDQQVLGAVARGRKPARLLDERLHRLHDGLVGGVPDEARQRRPRLAAAARTLFRSDLEAHFAVEAEGETGERESNARGWGQLGTRSHGRAVCANAVPSQTPHQSRFCG